MPSARGRARDLARNTKNKYDAAGTGRRIARWNPPATGPIAATQGIEKLRNRTRDSIRNDWAAESTVQKWTTTLIGTGIQPRFKNKAHRALWDLFVPQADADGVLDAYGLQALAIRSFFSGGEVFERRRPRAVDSPLEIPVQVQLIESDQCPHLDATAWPGLPVGHEIRQGIERNRFGRRTAYWFWRDHPGDGKVSPRADQLIRVAASEIKHVFEPTRPGQLRGVSPLAPVLVRLRNSMDFEDAVLDRQKLANLFTMFITRTMPPDSQIDYDPQTGLPVWYDREGRPLVGLEPGMSQELEPGEDIKFANPPEAGVSYPDYQRTNHLGTAAGTGTPYEFMSGDIRDVSDRSMRVLVNEYRRFAQQRQWHLAIPMICQPMVEWCMDAAVLAGKLSLSELAEAKTPKWVPNGWEYMHPVQDAQGKQILHDLGVLSKSQIILERGDDPEEVLDQREADAKEEKARGLTPPEPQPGAAGGAAGPQQQQAQQALTRGEFLEFVERMEARALARESAVPIASAPAPQAGPDATIAAVLQAMREERMEFMSAIREIVVAKASAPTNVNVAAPEVHNHVAPAVPEIHNHIAPAVPEIHNHVEAPEAPVVNVAAPNVTVHNEVQPADVNVNLPERQTTSVIDRDRNGNITNVVQTERTIQ